MNENNLDLSVCIITWDANDLTIACLRSLVQHTKAIEYEIILVDNGSSDETVKNVRDNFPQVRLIINPTDTGYSYANNQALAVAKGRYSVLLNNDMLFKSDALSKMVVFMDKNSDVGVLGCRLRLLSGEVQKTAHEDLSWLDYLFSSFFLDRLFPRSRVLGRVNSTYLDYEANDLVVDTGWVAGAGLLVRTDSLRDVGLLDKKIVSAAEDWEWCRRFAKKGYRVVYYTGAEIIHYGGMSASNYVGRDRDNVRRHAIMRQVASVHYVFRKLNQGSNAKIFLFNLTFRIYCLSRAIAFKIRNILKPNSLDHGNFQAYRDSILIGYKRLCESYLRFEN